MLRLFAKIHKRTSKNVKKVEKIHIDAEKLINSSEMEKKDGWPDYLWNNYFFGYF